jgi:uncharacterized protein YjiS (DUF1127 family)
MARTLATVTTIGPERSRRAHPSMQDRRVEDVGPPEQLALWERQLLASTVRRWKKHPPTDVELDEMADVLLGDVS